MSLGQSNLLARDSADSLPFGMVMWKLKKRLVELKAYMKPPPIHPFTVKSRFYTIGLTEPLVHLTLDPKSSELQFTHRSPRRRITFSYGRNNKSLQISLEIWML
jgi:hypothetical protein